MEELGIYIHIPFCKKKCSYCDFKSFENVSENKKKEYVDALIKEIQLSKNNSNHIVNTIYIGGGTPSFIGENYIKEILQAIYKKWEIKPDAEITIEVNPGTINKNKLEAYKLMGINRLSIGLQSTSDYLLKKIGRIHSYEDFLDTYIMARKVGFENINVDLMLALPEQTLENLMQSVRKIINLNPEHISIYSLILEENTELFSKVKKGEEALAEDRLEREMYCMVSLCIHVHFFEILSCSFPKADTIRHYQPIRDNASTERNQHSIQQHRTFSKHLRPSGEQPLHHINRLIFR